MDIGRLIATEDRASVERWCRQLTQQAYLGENKLLCRILGKLFCYVDGRDTGLAPYLMLDGFWEMWVTQAVCRFVKPKMTCIDVGASFGYYTLLLADLVGERGRVVSFEADGKTVCDYLLPSIEVNGFKQRTVVHARAVGAELGKGWLAQPDTRWSDGKVTTTPVRTSTCVQRPVIINALDTEVLPTEDKIDFIKIDAEGSEYAIWQGMQGLLQRDNPILLMEFSPYHLGSSAEKLLTEIQAAGYPLRHVAHTGNPEPITGAQLLGGGVDMLWLDRR